MSPSPFQSILGAGNNKVVDKSLAMFGATSPLIWSGKPTVGDFDGDGRPDILLCDRGRNQGNSPTYGTEYSTPGLWGGQNEVWDGTKFNKTMDLVTAPFEGWGWSATADFDKNGFADVTGDAKVLWRSRREDGRVPGDRDVQPL